MGKREIPLALHEFLDEFVKPRIHRFDYKVGDNTNEFLFELRGKKPNDGFFFQVFQRPDDDVILKMCPFSKTELNGSYIVNKKHLNRWIEGWEQLIEQYNNLQSPFFDDPITHGYEEEFFNQWKILEDDADTKPFDLKQQILIDKYLESAIQKLETLKTKENEKEIEVLKAQANEIRQNLTRQTKNQVVRGLAKFWAMARKMGLDVLRDIFIDLASGVIQKMLMG